MPRFHVTHARDGKFERRGLRSYFEYRDLGIKRATKGKVVAHVIRARAGKAPHGEWHCHETDVQFVYVLKGWVLFEYEGIGRVMMKAGSCFDQPRRLRLAVAALDADEGQDALADDADLLAADMHRGVANPLNERDQAMMSGISRARSRWIWSLSESLRFLSR